MAEKGKVLSSPAALTFYMKTRKPLGASLPLAFMSGNDSRRHVNQRLPADDVMRERLAPIHRKHCVFGKEYFESIQDDEEAVSRVFLIDTLRPL